MVTDDLPLCRRVFHLKSLLHRKRNRDDRGMLEQPLKLGLVRPMFPRELAIGERGGVRIL